jgi:hypothetical protein
MAEKNGGSDWAAIFLAFIVQRFFISLKIIARMLSRDTPSRVLPVHGRTVAKVDSIGLDWRSAGGFSAPSENRRNVI